jgi:hypothetical protein
MRNISCSLLKCIYLLFKVEECINIMRKIRAEHVDWNELNQQIKTERENGNIFYYYYYYYYYYYNSLLLC